MGGFYQYLLFQVHIPGSLMGGVFPGFPINIAIFRMLCYRLATIISMMKWNKNHGSLSKQD